MDKKTEALKLALEALEAWKDYYATHWDKIDEQAITAIREALAEQPAQHPVAVVKALPMGHNQTDMHYAECQHLPVGTLLYTSPPASKPWVGLTDEEKSDLWCKSTGRDCVNEDTHVFADAIEAKLKEKNA